MKTLFTLITFLGLGLSVPIFADHTPDHKCDCTEECAANCKAHNENLQIANAPIASVQRVRMQKQIV